MFVFDMKKHKVSLNLVEGLRVDNALKPNGTELGGKLRKIDAIIWCSEHCPSATFGLRNISPPIEFNNDLVINGIHPLIDGMTWRNISERALSATLDPLMITTLNRNMSQIIDFVTPTEGSEPGWVLIIDSETKAVEFRLRFGEEYPLVR